MTEEGFSQHSQSLMILDMAEEYWRGFRERIERLLLLPDWTAKRLATEASVGESTISQFRHDPKLGRLQRNIHAKVLAVLDRYAPEPASKPGEQIAGQRQTTPVHLSGIDEDEIPVVDIRYFPRRIPEGQMRQALNNARHSWHRRAAHDPKDPDLFYLTIHEKIGRAEPDDELKVSPAIKPYDGARVAVELADRVEIAEYLIFGDQRVVRFRSGSKLPEAECNILGTVIGFYTDRLFLE